MKHISLLLGAGFSVNKGYPTGSDLNNKILNLKITDFCVSTGGTVAWLTDGQDDPFNYSIYYTYKVFTLDCIKLYAGSNSFDYEKFYDFYKIDVRNAAADSEFNIFCDDFRKKYNCEENNINLLMHLDNIYNQLIGGLLVDGEGNKFYEPVHYCEPIYPGYTGILNCLKSWGKDYKVHIHTLNHDLFFETFKSSDWLQGELDDGFQELGSPYYGDFQERFKVRLPVFTDTYKKKFNLYKLHGSIDQYPFHLANGIVETYIKNKNGIGAGGLYKETVDENNELVYINDWINYHSDFLSGTSAKILRYREPTYYEKVFQNFEQNLKNSEYLILIGYGCGDSEINNLIEKFYKGYNRIFVVDPYPQEKTQEFCNRFDAIMIERHLQDLTENDFN